MSEGFNPQGLEDSSNPQDNIRVKLLEQKVKSNIQELQGYIYNYDQLGPNGKKKVCSYAADWVISSAFPEMDPNVINKIEEICSPEQANSFNAMPEQLAELRSSYALQTLLNGNPNVIQSYFNLQQEDFIKFAEKFAEKFAYPSPLNLEKHIQAKQIFNNNFGQPFIEKLIQAISTEQPSEPACRALLYTCRWYPPEWYSSYQDAVNSLLGQVQNEKLIQYPCLIYAEIISANRAYLGEMELLQGLVMHEMEDTQSPNFAKVYGSLFESQAHLFEVAAILMLVDNHNPETISQFLEFAGFFFNPEKYTIFPQSNNDEVTLSVIRVLSRIARLVSGEHLIVLLDLICTRMAQYLNPQYNINPELNINKPILLKTTVVDEMQEIMSNYLARAQQQDVVNWIAERLQNPQDEFTVHAIFALFIPAHNNQNIQQQTDQIFEQFAEILGQVAQTGDAIPPEYYPHVILPIEYISVKEPQEVEQYYPLCYHTLYNAYNAMANVTSNSPQYAQKDEIAKILTKFVLQTQPNIENLAGIDQFIQNIVVDSNSAKSAVKLAAALMAIIPPEGFAQIGQPILEHIRSNTNVNVNNTLIWLSNLPRILDDNFAEQVSQYLMDFYQNNRVIHLHNWISAFKPIALFVIPDFIPNFLEVCGTLSLTHAAFFDLLQTAASQGEFIRTHESPDDKAKNNAHLIVNQDWTAQNIPMLQEQFQMFISCARYVPTNSQTFKECVLPLITNGLEFFNGYRSTLGQFEGNLDNFGIFIHDQILAERYDCPEIYKIALYKMASFWSGTASQVNGVENVDLNRATYLARGTFYWFFAPSFHPNIAAWNIAITNCVRIHLSLFSNAFKNIQSLMEEGAPFDASTQGKIAAVNQIFVPKFIQEVFSYIANKISVYAELLPALVRQEQDGSTSITYISSLVESSKADKTMQGPYFAKIVKEQIPLYYLMHLMVRFDE